MASFPMTRQPRFAIAVLAGLCEQHFHFLLCGAQRVLALPRERDAALESLECVFERHIAGFEFLHQRFEFGERLLEVLCALRFLGFGFHARDFKREQDRTDDSIDARSRAVVESAPLLEQV